MILYWVIYCLILTLLIKFIYQNRYKEIEFTEVFLFVILSLFICNISPAIYILLIANVRF